MFKVLEALDIKSKFNSLKFKIVFWFSSIVFVILILFSLVFYYYFNQNYENQILNNFEKIAFQIKNNQIPAGVEFAIFKNKKILQKTKNFNIKKINFNNKFVVYDKGEYLNIIYISDFNNKKIVILKKNIDDKSENIVDTLLVLEPILMLLLILVSMKAIDKILIPIKTITSLSKDITIQNFQSTINSDKNEIELKELINSFNEMIYRIQDGVNNLEKFNSDISHELKTPLTIIKGEINVTLKKIRQPKEYINSMKIILVEIEELQKIIDNLLLLSKYTKENISQTFEKFDMDMVLLKSIEKYEKFLYEKKISINIEKFENIVFYGNETFFYHIFLNLIDNSIKYSNSNTTITIKLYKKNEKIYFIIKDEGIGIPKDKLDKVTQKFYRIDESRNKNIEGFGLGLSIVQNNVNLHNGKLTIISNNNQGTKIILEF